MGDVWAEVDAVRSKLYAESRVRQQARRQEARTGRDGVHRPIIRHVARCHFAYVAKTARGETREMAPGDLWRKTFGAAALKSLIVRALCGDVRANEEKKLHRTTSRVKTIGCTTCRVLLDRELESERLVVNPRGVLEARRYGGRP